MLVPHAMAVPVCFSIIVISMTMIMPTTMAMSVSEGVAISGCGSCQRCSHCLYPLLLSGCAGSFGTATLTALPGVGIIVQVPFSSCIAEFATCPPERYTVAVVSSVGSSGDVELCEATV